MIYLTSTDNKARYALGSLGKKPLVVFGVNPSTATDVLFDRTIRRIEGYSRTHGFDGWLMLNLYPQRATNPDDLHATRDETIHAANLAAIAQCFSSIPDPALCAAWGGLIEKRDYLQACLLDIRAMLKKHEWHVIGNPTQKGHPRHPLYIRATTPLQQFPIEIYLQQISPRDSRI